MDEIQQKHVDSLLHLIEKDNAEGLAEYIIGLSRREGAPPSTIVGTLANVPSPAIVGHETLMHRASFCGSVKSLQFLLEHGGDPNALSQSTGSTPLHSAAAAGRADAIMMLVGAGAAVNVLNNQAWTPLHSCASRGFLDAGILLLKAGAILNARNSEGTTPSRYYADSPVAAEWDVAVQHFHGARQNTPPPLRIQVVSDLHVEFFDSGEIPSDIIVPSAPYLALVGDIGAASTEQYKSLLKHLADRYEKVLVVAGNHEYYNRPGGTEPLEHIRSGIASYCESSSRLEFMDKKRIVLDGVPILGCTLWSHIPEHAKSEVQSSMADFQRIYTNSGPGGFEATLTCSHVNAMHAEDAAWLQDELKQSMDRKEQNVVVLTHYAPTIVSSYAKKHGTPFSNHLCHAFATPMEHLFRSYLVPGNSNVHTWIHGHTHHNHDTMVHGTRVVANQFGYHMRKEALSNSYSNRFVCKVP